jgi:GT2 family glycosyltransferase
MRKTIIIALKYDELDWMNTWSCIAKCKCPVIIADRSGVGNMALAFNKAFQENLDIINKYEYVWFLTNIIFDASILKRMEETLDANFYSVLHPAFRSDHKHCNPNYTGLLSTPVPFVEFTAPIMRVNLFKRFPLDIEMPYWGHDLDWGYRVNQAGYKIGVHHGCQVEHTYIRNNHTPDPVTIIRKQMRKLLDDHTENRLIEKYGKEWNNKLKYEGDGR